MPPNVTPAALSIVRSFIVLPAKVEAGITWADEPLNAIVPAVAVKVPLLLTAPYTCNIAALTVKDPPDWIVRSLELAVPLPIVG